MTYFSNGCEGMILDEQCSECKIGIENYCPIACVQSEYNYKQHYENGRFKGHIGPVIKGIMETLIEGGICRMKKCIDEALKEVEG